MGNAKARGTYEQRKANPTSIKNKTLGMRKFLRGQERVKVKLIDILKNEPKLEKNHD